MRDTDLLTLAGERPLRGKREGVRGEWALAGAGLASMARVAHFFREGETRSACSRAQRSWAAKDKPGSPQVIPCCVACKRIAC
jgi:hypothetical protein